MTTRATNRQRAFREKHKPDAPPYVGIWLREGDAHLLAAGLVSDSLKQIAQEALMEFWPAAETEATR